MLDKLPKEKKNKLGKEELFRHKILDGVAREVLIEKTSFDWRQEGNEEENPGSERREK